MVSRAVLVILELHSSLASCDLCCCLGLFCPMMLIQVTLNPFVGTGCHRLMYLYCLLVLTLRIGVFLFRLNLVVLFLIVSFFVLGRGQLIQVIFSVNGEKQH